MPIRAFGCLPPPRRSLAVSDPFIFSQAANSLRRVQFAAVDDMRRTGNSVALASVAMMRSLLRLGVLATLCSLICLSPTAAHSPGLDGAISPERLPGPKMSQRIYQFNVEKVNKSVNCWEKPIVTINGQFPGPTLYVNEDDRVVVNVTNNTPSNMTIHFHGVRQVLSPWMDGVAYVTQCPIAPGDYFTHEFFIPNQQGTLLYHAHIGWQRATVHGAIITYPKEPLPYPKPFRDFPVILAEWWNEDIEELELSRLATGELFPVSDAMTINGAPGPGYNCSAQEGVSTLRAIYGKTYKLRIINAATNAHLFFSVANHSLRVVEADAEYVQPFDTPIIMLSPGQTTDALITADQEGGTYYMSASDYGREDILKPNPVAIFTYETPKSLLSQALDVFLHFPGQASVPQVPALPAYDDTDQVFVFHNALRTLYPGRVPPTIDQRMFLTVGLISRKCSESPVTNCTPASQIPGGAPNSHILGAVNNITFENPTIAILQASYYNISGVFREDFPTRPEYLYDFTSRTAPANRLGEIATRVIPVKYNDTVQIVLQDTTIWGFENHPFHLHGHNFWVMGQGFGNYDDSIDGNFLNDYDPPLRNTVGVPYQGWTVIRFKANNPGVWFFHCHLDKHASWGMAAVFNIKNGVGPRHTYLPPPARLMKC